MLYILIFYFKSYFILLIIIMLFTLIFHRLINLARNSTLIVYVIIFLSFVKTCTLWYLLLNPINIWLTKYPSVWKILCLIVTILVLCTLYTLNKKNTILIISTMFIFLFSHVLFFYYSHRIHYAYNIIEKDTLHKIQNGYVFNKESFLKFLSILVFYVSSTNALYNAKLIRLEACIAQNYDNTVSSEIISIEETKSELMLALNMLTISLDFLRLFIDAWILSNFYVEGNVVLIYETMLYNLKKKDKIDTEKAWTLMRCCLTN